MTTPPTVDAVYAKSNAEVIAIHQALLASLRSLGPVTVDPKKTSIHFARRTAFGGLHPRKAYLNLNIRLDRPLDAARVVSTEQVSKNRWHNLVRLDAPSDIDAELLAWLSEAYTLAA